MAAPTLAGAVAARARVDRIKIGVEAIWALIVESYQARDWEALGYASWDDMCTREFGTSRLRLPREERQEIVSSLREQGLSLRAIASATGTGTRQVQEALQPEVCSKNTPEPESFAPSGLDEFVDHTTGEITEPDHVLTEKECEQIDRASRPKLMGLDGKNYPST